MLSSYSLSLYIFLIYFRTLLGNLLQKSIRKNYCWRKVRRVLWYTLICTLSLYRQKLPTLITKMQKIFNKLSNYRCSFPLPQLLLLYMSSYTAPIRPSSKLRHILSQIKFLTTVSQLIIHKKYIKTTVRETI